MALLKVGYSIDVLMEQAGQAVAYAVRDLYPVNQYPTPLCFIGRDKKVQLNRST